VTSLWADERVYWLVDIAQYAERTVELPVAVVILFGEAA
jgi:hypothetical protein